MYITDQTYQKSIEESGPCWPPTPMATSSSGTTRITFLVYPHDDLVLVVKIQ